MEKILAVIPARGGSKGVKRKNIRELNGRPLIAWTIEQAKKSKYIDRVVVSTEDEEIAKISKEYGAEVPFLRPEELAKDHTSGIDPVIHCIEWLEKNQKYHADYVVLLQCTSPKRKAEQIDEAIEKMLSQQGRADSIISVCRAEHSPYWMQKVNDSGLLEDFIRHDRVSYARRQDLPEVFRLNGAIYIAKTKSLLENRDFQTNRTLPYIMDEFSSLDIDNELDFRIAELIMNEGEIY